MPKPFGSSVSALESHVGYWLRFVSNHVSHAFRLKVESHGVTVAEWVMLRAMFDLEAAYPSDLAKTLGLTRGAVSKLTERLSKKGLLRMRAERLDRRYQSVILTEAGRKLVPVLARLADKNDAEYFEILTVRERTGLLRMLNRIVTHHGLKATPVD